MEVHPLDSVAYNQKHKQIGIQRKLFICKGFNLVFCDFMKVTIAIHLLLYLLSKKWFPKKLQIKHKVEPNIWGKKETVNVRIYALKFQHVVEEGWCNESAASFNLKCNERLTGGLQKPAKDFAHKW